MKTLSNFLKLYIILTVFMSVQAIQTPLYFCTAANAEYYTRLLNLIGSIHESNYDNLGAIVVVDLGLAADQLAELNTFKKTLVIPIDTTNPTIMTPVRTTDWGKVVPGWYSWKPIAVKQALELFPYVLWIDAGATVLRPLDHLFEYLCKNKYFLCTLGDALDTGEPAYPVQWGTTRYVREKFALDTPERQFILTVPFVTANVYGVTREGANVFLDDLVALTSDMRNFQDDGTTANGFGTGRHDQVLLSILSYLHKAKVFFQDYKQVTPIKLPLHNGIATLYITWDGSYVCDKTHIYNSRGNMIKFEYYRACIKRKSSNH